LQPEIEMPLFRYHITRGSETKTTELRKSNPQGWLLDAVKATFPDVASRRGGDVMRLRLVAGHGVKQSWHATLQDPPIDLVIQVAQARV
jgi:hypothetical protein